MGPFRLVGPFLRINQKWWDIHMKRKVDRQLNAAMTEQKAHEEWAAQQKLMGQIHDDLMSLPLEARAKIFAEFCCACGVDNPKCTCTWSEEEKRDTRQRFNYDD